MNRYTLIFTFLSSLFLISGCDSVVNSETVNYFELTERGGIYYKKFSHVPFTGKTTGKEQGSMKKGKKEDEWFTYLPDGKLSRKATYKNGKKEEDEVVWYYNEYGQLGEKVTYKNGKKEGEYVRYHDNGQVSLKGTYKNGKEEGEWVWYHFFRM